MFDGIAVLADDQVVNEVQGNLCLQANGTTSYVQTARMFCRLDDSKNVFIPGSLPTTYTATVLIFQVGKCFITESCRNQRFSGCDV